MGEREKFIFHKANINMKFNRDNFVEIYQKILKYPMFSVNDTTEISHEFKNKGQIKLQAKKAVNIEDEEKFFAILYLLQTGKAKIVEKIELKSFNTTASVIEVKISDISELTNCNSYEHILDSVRKISSCTLEIFMFEKGKAKKTFFTYFFPFYEYISEKKVLNIFIDDRILIACQKKPLKLNIADYLCLKGHAKNLYKYLSSNVSKEKFHIYTITKRCHIKAKRKSEIKRAVKRALITVGKTQMFRGKKITIKDDFIYLKNSPFQNK